MLQFMFGSMAKYLTKELSKEPLFLYSCVAYTLLLKLLIIS